MDQQDAKSDANSDAYYIQQLEGEVESLHSELEDCKTSLFSLLHEDPQVTEAAIKKSFEEIAYSIEIWIDRVFKDEDKEFRTTLQSRLENQAAKKQLLQSGLSISDRDLDQLFRVSTCNLLIVSLLIWDHLRRDVFQKAFPIGLSKSHVETIADVEDIMKGNEFWSSSK